MFFFIFILFSSFSLCFLFMVDSSGWRTNYFEGFILGFAWKSCRRFTTKKACCHCLYVILYLYMVSLQTKKACCHFLEFIQYLYLFRENVDEFIYFISASAIFIGVYEPTKQKLLKSCPENLSALAHLTAGAAGGAASSIIRVPTEVVKQRMQTGHFASAPDAVRLIVAKEGFKGLFAGYSSFLLRDLPFDAIQFCIYEQLRIGYKLAVS
ncbi:putative mitochondrial carrier domain superfamily [Helianthus annuus]|nr:putative mitochondrial carrier domain superfamily [Helianthus annuus]